MSDLSAEIDAYAAYLNVPADRFEDPDQRAMFEADRAKARRAMEIAWLDRLRAI
jgi:hypothetical protein